MTTVIVSFRSEREAQDAINRLNQAGLGDVRARVLDSSEPLSYPKTPSTSPMITPDMGTLEVRPTEIPRMPESMHEDNADNYASASIPTTGGQGTTGGKTQGVQVMIEVDGGNEDRILQILGMSGGESGEQVGE